MLLPHEGSGSLRVLGLFPHPRHTGHVVLDERGLVADGHFASETRHHRTHAARSASVEQLLRSSVARYRPSVIAIVGACGATRVRKLVVEAIDIATSTEVPVQIIDEQFLSELFEDDAANGYDRLGQAIVRTFLPTLTMRVPSWGKSQEDRRRRLRPVWKAAAAAIFMLALKRPEAVRALARQPIPKCLALFLDDPDLPPAL